MFAMTLFWTSSWSQDSLSLSQCFQLLETNHPLARQVNLTANMSNVRQQQLTRNYWPKLEVQGQATWQNEVTRVDIPITIPGFETPTAPQDQYRLIGEITQTIYDGGATRHLRSAARSEHLAAQLQTAGDLYRLRFQVHQLYFGILMIREQRNVLNRVQSELQRKEKQVADLFANGVAQRKEMDLLAVERIRHQQTLDQNRIQETTLVENLGELIGKNLKTDDLFSVPDGTETGQVPRTEWAVFSAQRDVLEAQKKLIVTQRLPKVNAFVQGGIGQPGYNLFDPDPAPMFLAGARLRWNLGAFYLDAPDRELIHLQEEILRQKENGFGQGLSLQVRQAMRQAQTYERFLISDLEMLEKRTRIKEIAAVQLTEGIITTADYLREVDAWYQADLQYELHRIQAIQYAIEALLLAGQ